MSTEQLMVVQAYALPETRAVADTGPELESYFRVVGLDIGSEPTAWDERPADATREHYDVTELDFRSFADQIPPADAGESKRVRRSTLQREQIEPAHLRLAESEFQRVLTFLPESVPFAELKAYIVEGNKAAARPATYDEALYALELARLITADEFEQRISCFELSLIATFLCLSNDLSADWCLGMSMENGQPHVWIEVGNEPVRGDADEIVTGVYKRLARIGTTITR